MRRINFATVLVICLVSTSVFAEGKTMQEWLREADAAFIALNEKVVVAEGEKTAAGKGLSDAARKGESAALLQYKDGLVRACGTVGEMATWFDKEGYLADEKDSRR